MKRDRPWLMPHADRDLRRIERKAQRSGKPANQWKDVVTPRSTPKQPVRNGQA